jgi:hypothetical protein
MTLRANAKYAQRTAQVIDSSFATTGSDLNFYSGVMPTTGTLSLTGSDPKYFNTATYAGQFVLTTVNWSFKQLNDTLVFDPADYPPVVSSPNAGLITWCALIGPTVSTNGTIIGKVTLGGGDGLVQIANDGTGGGTGLNVFVGDNISVVSFGMKWEI